MISESQDSCIFLYTEKGASLPVVKKPLAMQETRVRALGRKDVLEMGMATHSSILTSKIPWTEGLGGL